VLISLLLAGLTALFEPRGLLGRFEGIASDVAMPRGEADPSTAVVAIDSRALAEVEPSWPWPRSRYAELVKALDAAGARLIVFDIVFASPADGDAELASAISDAGNVVLGATALDPEDGSDTSRGPGYPRTNTVLPPVEPLAQAARAVGQTQVTPDPNDGVVREVPLVVEDDRGAIVPALSLAAMATEADQSATPILRRPSGVQVAGRAIPTNDTYDMRVSYPPELWNAQKFHGPVHSAADVLRGDAAEQLRDKVVFVGVTDVSLGDRVLVPGEGRRGLPGVMVQASAFDTMASQAYITTASTLETTMWVLLLSLVVTLAIQFLPGWIAGLTAVGALVAYLFGAYFRSDAGTFMNVTYPVVAVALAVPSSLAVRYFGEIRQRRRVDALFSQYVPARVAKQLIDDGHVERVTAGQRVEVTAMFCDLRGFTERSSRLEPTTVNKMLEDFYEYSATIVLDHGGTLMTYIGDEIFVVFGAPIQRDDHAAAALACAKEIQERIDELDSIVTEHGFDPLRFGIGLHGGEIVASHTGSHTRRQYTAIGTTVNIAARLTSRAGPGRVVLSEEVRSQLDPPPPVKPMVQQQMKGVRADFLAWSLILDKEPSGAEDRD
jgi:adenylate cyclase